MTRVKNGASRKRKHKKILKLAKGFVGSHSKLFTVANQQTMKALRYSFYDRRKKGNTMKRLWIQRINVVCKENKKNYNHLIKNLKEEKILINKKMLAKLSIIDKNIINRLILTAKI